MNISTEMYFDNQDMRRSEPDQAKVDVKIVLDTNNNELDALDELEQSYRFNETPAAYVDISPKVQMPYKEDSVLPISDDHELMVELEHNQGCYDNFFKSGDYDIFNEKDSTELNNQLMKFQDQLGLGSPPAIHGPFELQQPPVMVEKPRNIDSGSIALSPDSNEKEKMIVVLRPSTQYSTDEQSLDPTESHSDLEDEIYVPFEYKGDGRKREAKKHKL